MKFAAGDLIRLTDNNRSLGVVTDAKEDAAAYGCLACWRRRLLS